MLDSLFASFARRQLTSLHELLSLPAVFLRLLRAASPLALRLFGLFHFWSFCHEVDGVLAGESFNGGNLRSEDG